LLAPDVRRLVLARAEVDRERKRVSATPLDQTLDTEIRTVDETQEKLIRKFSLQNAFADLASRPSVANGPNEIGQLIGGDDHVRTSFAAADQSGSLALSSWAPASDGFAGRLLTALAAALIIAGLFWLARRGEISEAAARWPQWLGVVAGLAWWLWLAPSVAGWVIVVASVAATVWRRRRSKEIADSVALRSPRGGSSAATSQAAISHWGQSLD
jgi:hypothetical protein